MMESLMVVKIGGNVIDDEQTLVSFLKKISSIKGKKILVHGGGVLATQLAGQLGIPQEMKEGRRITNKETLKIVTMVYAGWINKTIVTLLQSFHCNAIGVTGADAGIIKAHKRLPTNIDYGWVGDIDSINVQPIIRWLQDNLSIVVAPITYSPEGYLLNTNADTIAQTLATYLSPYFRVSLIYLFEKKGVLKNIEDNSSCITHIHAKELPLLKQNKIIYAGMIPKLENAFEAIAQGVHAVHIGMALDIEDILLQQTGTTLLP